MSMIESERRSSDGGHFSPAERQSILGRLLTAMAQDDRIRGVLVVGSGATGFADAYSDIDLCVVVERPEEVRGVFEAWGRKLRQLLRIFFAGESVRGENVFLWVLLLDNFLELDISFQCLDDLEARRGHWTTAFDRSGRIEAILKASWARRKAPDVQTAYDRIVSWAWHYVMRAAMATQRGELWRALWELEQVRSQAIELRGLRTGLDTKRFRSVDRMAPSFLSAMERTLVVELTRAEILRALREATTSLFAEAEELDAILGCDLGERFGPKLRRYLQLLEELAGPAQDTGSMAIP